MRQSSAIVAMIVASTLFGSAAWAGCLEDVRKAGVLTSGNGIMGSKPAIWQNQDGSHTGLEWELFQEIGKRLHVPEVKPIVTEWTTLIPGLKAQRWDIILSGMTVTQERIQGGGIEYSKPYFMLYDYVIVKEDSPIKTVADLRGKTLASVLGTLDSLTAHSMVDAGEAANVLDFNTFGEPWVALQNGQADAVILDQSFYHGQRETMRNLRVVGEPIYRKPKPQWAEAEAKAPYVLGALAIGVRRECGDLLTALNEALDAMEADGTRKAILEKYGEWAPEQAKLMK